MKETKIRQNTKKADTKKPEVSKPAKKEQKPEKKKERSVTPKGRGNANSSTPKITVSNLDSSSSSKGGKFKGALAIKIKPLIGSDP